MSAIEYVIENLKWAMAAARSDNNYAEVRAIASELAAIINSRGF